MGRTKLRERLLPDYTRGEEIFNMVSHIVGGGLGVIVLAVSVILSAIRQNPWAIFSSIIYGLSFIQLYTISSVYHGLRPGMGKKVLQVIDHCTIYLFIAGTYTPLLLCALRPAYPLWAWILFGVVWGLASLAIVLTAIDLKQFAVFSMICYIGMGWCIILAIRPLMMVLPIPALVLLVSGGVVYTIGAVLYGLGRNHRYMHSLFHLFVLAGSVLHALCILLYVL